MKTVKKLWTVSILGTMLGISTIGRADVEIVKFHKLHPVTLMLQDVLPSKDIDIGLPAKVYGAIFVAAKKDSFYSIECFKVFGRAPVEGEGCKISKVKDLDPNESIWPIFDLMEHPNTTSSPIHCEPMSKNPFCWEN